ncbi:hypothetical protein [Clostridium manihotivorum]|nr:hypothetical protein [Clostridium manihotivorum]
MKKSFFKAIVTIMFIGMFLVPIVGNNFSIHNGTISATGIQDPGVIE